MRFLRISQLIACAYLAPCASPTAPITAVDALIAAAAAAGAAWGAHALGWPAPPAGLVQLAWYSPGMLQNHWPVNSLPQRLPQPLALVILRLLLRLRLRWYVSSPLDPAA
jgi:hypothetical protein